MEGTNCTGSGRRGNLDINLGHAIKEPNLLRLYSIMEAIKDANIFY